MRIFFLNPMNNWDLTSPVVGLNLCSATHDSEMNTITLSALIQIKTGKTPVKQGTRAGRAKVTHDSNFLHHPDPAPGSDWTPGEGNFSAATKFDLLKPWQKISDIFRPETKFLQKYFFHCNFHFEILLKAH